MKGKHAQKNFGAVGAMAPTPLSLKTQRGGGGGLGGVAYKDRARPPPRVHYAQRWRLQDVAKGMHKDGGESGNDSQWFLPQLKSSQLNTTKPDSVCKRLSRTLTSISVTFTPSLARATPFKPLLRCNIPLPSLFENVEESTQSKTRSSAHHQNEQTDDANLRGRVHMQMEASS